MPRSFHRETKDEILEEISRLLDIPIHNTVRGGTVLIEFVLDVARSLSVDETGPKLEVLRRCFDKIGKDWRPEYASEHTNSGGGGTITVSGLTALHNGLIDYISRVEPAPPLSSIALIPYTAVVETYPHEGEFAPGVIDADLLKDGFERHNQAQNRLANFLKDENFEVFSSSAGAIKFDILWKQDERYFLGEVKSITNENEESQLRTALGQVLRYKSQLGLAGVECTAVIITDKPVSDVTWFDACKDNSVLLISPETFTLLLY